MIQRTIACGTAALTLALSATIALASGSDGGGSAETGDAAAYNMGKSVYASKLACANCPMAGKSLDAAMARQLIEKAPAVTLSDDESKALAVYLKRRFKL